MIRIERERRVRAVGIKNRARGDADALRYRLRWW
jgi:hypothetical protein